MTPVVLPKIVNGSCPEHGPDEISAYRRKNGNIERRCQACIRAKHLLIGKVKRNYGGPRCIRGHLKTPWTWRRYHKKTGQIDVRCLPCQYEREREREQERRRLRSTDGVEGRGGPAQRDGGPSKEGPSQPLEHRSDRRRGTRAA